MGRRNKLLIAVLFLAVAAYFGYNYLYQDHRDIQSEEAAMESSAGELLELFKNNDTPDVLNSTVSVSGTITQVESNAVTLDNGVHCTFDGPVEGLSEGDQVTIKGRCIGYDDLFEVVKLDQSTKLN